MGSETKDPSGSYPAWTGAVGEAADSEVPASWPSDALSELKKGLAGKTLGFDEIEFLLYAACEWHDEDAGRAACRALLSKAAPGSLKTAAACARLLWNAHALIGGAELREAAQSATESIERNFSAPNADAVLALFAADAFSDSGLKRRERALGALSLLEKRVLTAEGGGDLQSNARAILAFAQAFEITGKKAFRERADGLARGLFQELWDRERGGFFEPGPDAASCGADERLAANAAAFEAVWRVRHMSGNSNYGKWLAWGIRGLFALSQGRPIAARAGLARVFDMMSRGRLHLEIVGLPEDAQSSALVSACRRVFSPRAGLSWISPDDQDYIMAHKLQAPSYPRLFGCVELRPIGSAQTPDEVPALMRRLSEIGREA
ncbi:MAG: hypothetical protein ACYCPQ_09440 [Elusimicrobiota bacterium]